MKSKLPCEIQLDRLNEFGHYRGDQVVSVDGEVFAVNNVFTISAYRNEISSLMDNQKQYHAFIDEDFVDQYLEIFNSKRAYYDGPGNEKSRTDYGRYTTEIDQESGEYITVPNLFEKLIGKCNVYPEQFRASAGSYSAQEFNMLNDLNNLKVNGIKLTEGQKREIVQVVLSSNVVNMKNIIKKVINEPIESFSGARIDAKDKEIFHTFELFRKMKKVDALRIEDLSRETLDELGHILTINTDKEAILCAFSEAEHLGLSFEIQEAFVEFRKKNSAFFNKWHSFSLKIIKELIPQMYVEPKNQMEILTERGVFKSNTDLYKEYNKLSAKLILDEIYNPVVKRSVNQSVKVINKIIDCYGYPDEIIVEMARDKNEKEQSKRIRDAQGKNEKELSSIIKSIHNEYGIEINEWHFQGHKALKTKLRLWHEQGGKCPYSGQAIRINELLDEQFKFEIDHVIPISISFDDSRSNKVLVYRSENQLKGNRTPFMYLRGLERVWNFGQYSSYVNDLYSNKQIKDISN